MHTHHTVTAARRVVGKGSKTVSKMGSNVGWRERAASAYPAFCIFTAWHGTTALNQQKGTPIMANQAPSNTNTASSTLPSILMRLFLSCELPYRYFVPGRWVVPEKKV